MKQKQLSLALAESMTCGMASGKLGNGIGTSDVFCGSVVCYVSEVKKKLFKIKDSQIKKYTCESKEITELLVKNLQHLIKADVYAAVTGLASAGGSEKPGKPVGTTFICIKRKDKIYHYRKLYHGSPLEIKNKACADLFKLILKKI